VNPGLAERIEPGRRLVHVAGVAFPLSYLLGGLAWAELRALLLVGVAVAAVLEFFRLVVRVDHPIYDRLTRPYEQDNPAGYALYIASVAGVALAFEPPAAVSGMLMLAIADPASGVLSSIADARAEPAAGDGGRADSGSRAGSTDDAGADPDAPTGTLGKRPAVIAATFGVCLALAVPVTVPEAGVAAGLAAAVAGAAGATLADGVTPVIRGYVVDDNLTIPPAAAVGIQTTFALANAGT